jgi:hypothetical protein
MAGGTPGGQAGTSGSKHYQIGDVGAGARVQQGEHLTMIGDTLSGLPEGDALVQQFEALLSRIREHPDLDPDRRELAVVKTQAVAEGLAKAQQDPSLLRRALVDAKAFFAGTATWVLDSLGTLLRSEAAQRTLATVTEASTQAAIRSLTGGV